MERAEAIKSIRDGLEEIRPFLQRDGGDIEFVDLKENNTVVEVRLLGTCVGCSVNQMTLKSGVEMTIKKHAPYIQKVVDVSGELTTT